MNKPIAATLGSAVLAKGVLMLLMLFASPRPASACIVWESDNVNYCASGQAASDCLVSCGPDGVGEIYNVYSPPGCYCWCSNC